jgi:hypothetical protein
VTELKRTLKTFKELEVIASKDPRNSDLYVAHWVADVYPNRSEHMEHMSLYELLSWYERERRGSDEKMLLKAGSFFLRRRTHKPHII